MSGLRHVIGVSKRHTAGLLSLLTDVLQDALEEWFLLLRSITVQFELLASLDDGTLGVDSNVFQ